MTKRPNLVFIIADDHARQAVGCYDSRFGKLTPNIDRIAAEGTLLENCCCTNAICSPSRATILTGAYSHVNGVKTNATLFDNQQDTFVRRFQASGYQTGFFGKWHLGHGEKHDPVGFDAWSALPNQGDYFDPEFLGPEGSWVEKGYVTDVITDQALAWLEERDKDKPFLLWVAHKAPHRHWDPKDSKQDVTGRKQLPLPDTLHDDYAGREAARVAKMRLDPDLKSVDLKQACPEGLSEQEKMEWKHQRFLEDYLAVCSSMDDNIGRVLDYLDEHGLAENTIVVYTSDHGLFLGEHGWFDKRFMYEESLGVPFVVRYPQEIAAGQRLDQIILNTDFAATFLDYAGLEPTEQNQGTSFRHLLQGKANPDWREAMYYRYWSHRDYSHNVYAHCGVRTARYKLIQFYNRSVGLAAARDDAETPPAWEFYDLEQDPHEVENLIEEAHYAGLIAELKDRLFTLQEKLQDESTRHLDLQTMV